MHLEIPAAARLVMETISRDGFCCYLVGGCVRDLLLGRQPADYDFVTDRSPAEIIAAAAKAGWKARQQGISFGVVKVLAWGKEYEIATMRSEAYGPDPHRPETIQFIAEIEKDLARRDFTINAMALDSQGRVIDPFGGQEDLRKQIIRCVGNPKERFLEDPLRILRAARFISRTGFAPDPGLAAAAALVEVRQRFMLLSVERVRDELEKVLLSPLPSRGLRYLAETKVLGLSCQSKTASGKKPVPILPEVAALEGVEQNPRFHAYDVLEHTLQTVDGTKALPELRWAALLHDVAKGRAGTRCLNKKGEPADYGHAAAGAKLAWEILERLKLPIKTKKLVVWLVRYHMILPGMDDEQMKRWVLKRSRDFSRREAFVEAVHLLLQLAEADNQARGKGVDPAYIKRVSDSFQRTMAKTVLYPSELALDGAYIAQKLGPGPQVGKTLGDLLVDVQQERLANTRETLQQAVEKKSRRLTRKQPAP